MSFSVCHFKSQLLNTGNVIKRFTSSCYTMVSPSVRAVSSGSLSISIRAHSQQVWTEDSHRQRSRTRQYLIYRRTTRMGKSYVLESDDFFCPSASWSVKGFLAVPFKATPNTPLLQHCPDPCLCHFQSPPLIPALKYTRLHTDFVYWLS